VFAVVAEASTVVVAGLTLAVEAVSTAAGDTAAGIAKPSGNPD
jgi:hypothetical protein